MTRFPLICLTTCLTTWFGVLAFAADPVPRTDADGFPLPTEAVRRFGSAKFCTDSLSVQDTCPTAIETACRTQEIDYTRVRTDYGLGLAVAAYLQRRWGGQCL